MIAAPWIARLALALAAILLALVGRKYVIDPEGAAAASAMTLGSPLAIRAFRLFLGRKM